MKYYTEKQLAELLQVCRQTIRNYANSEGNDVVRYQPNGKHSAVRYYLLSEVNNGSKA